MPELKGFMLPRSPEGRASIVPPPPWHYSGDVLTIEYRTDPGERRGAAAATASTSPTTTPARSRSSGPTGSRAATRARSSSIPCAPSTRSASSSCGARTSGEHYSRCVYIWVDKDFALARGWYQGYPKKLGPDLDDASGHGGQGRPSAGARRAVRRDAGRQRPAARRGHAHARPARSETGGFVNALPMLHSRWMPSIDPSQPAASTSWSRCARATSSSARSTPGEATVALHDAPAEELASLEPVETIAGYWRQVGATFAGGRSLARRACASLGPHATARFRHGDRIATGVDRTGSDDIVACCAGTFFEDPLPTGEEVPLDDVRLLAPVLPSKLVCVGKNYAAHAAEFGMEVPEEPLLFLKPSTAVIGPGDPIPLLPISQRVDYEGELAVVIGRLARNVRAEDAYRVHPRLHVRERRDAARPAEDRRPVGAREGLRRVVPARAVDRDRARPQRRRACETRLNGEVRQHAQHDRHGVRRRRR